MSYVSLRTDGATMVTVYPHDTGVSITLYSGAHSCADFLLSDELARDLATQLLASIQEREDARKAA